MQTTMEEDPAVQNSAKRKPKKRVRNFTSDDRAQHRVIEKQRRESLNSNFVVGLIHAIWSVGSS